MLHELYDQAALAAGVFGIARSAHSAQDVRDQLRAVPGLAAHRTPAPAYLEIPLDVLAEPTDLQAGRFEGVPLQPQTRSRRIDAAVHLLGAAARSSHHRGRRRRAAPAPNSGGWSRRWIVPW